MDIDFSGNGMIEYPIFVCPNCGPKSNEWEKWYNKYNDVYQNPENWEIKKHHVVCIVGDFCSQFSDFYKYPYRFSYRSPIPYKDKAFVMARRLLAMFDGNAKTVRNYIKWAFHFKVKNTNYQVNSLGFFVSEKFQQEYNNAKARAAVLRRSTPLPESFINWCEQNANEVFELRSLVTWNDLNGCVSYIKYREKNGPIYKVVVEAVNRKMLPSIQEYRKLGD